MKLQESLLNSQVVDLSHVITEQAPHFPIFKPAKMETVATHAANGFYAAEITMPTQYCTHIDPPGHFYEGGRLLDELSLDELVLPLYVLDFKAEVAADFNFRLDKEDIQAYETEHGQIEAGSFVAFASGWSERFTTQEIMDNKNEEGQDQVPGWGMSALEYLHEKGVKAIGHETLNTDASVDYVPKGGALDGEYYWLSKDHYQVEVMTNLDKVPIKGATIVVAPANYQGAPGIAVRPLAFF